MEAGFDEIYVANMGPHYAELMSAYGESVLPQLRASKGKRAAAKKTTAKRSSRSQR